MDAKIMSKFSTYKEELEIETVFDDNIYATKEGMKKYIKSFDSSDLDKFVIVKGDLLYVGDDDKELEIADRLGIGNMKSEGGKEIVKEVQNIVDYLGKIDEENIPPLDELIEKGESIDEENGYVGVPLVNRTEETVSNGSWDIVDSYTSDNQLDVRYGTGFFFLDKKTYKINGEELSLVNPAILNYKEKTFIVLGENMERWNKNSSLAGDDKDLIYNFDATMSPKETVKVVDEQILDEDVYHPVLNGKTQENVYWIGDVKTNESGTALMLNCSEENETKEGGFVSVKVDDMDMTNGMTMLFLGKLNQGYRESLLHHEGAQHGLISFLQITDTDITVWPKGRLFLSDKSGRGDLSNAGDLSAYKDIFYKVVQNGDFQPADKNVAKVKENELLSVVGSYRLNLCESDKELCERVGLDIENCDEYSFNVGNGFEHYISVHNAYQNNWKGITSGYIDIGMVSLSYLNNRYYLNGEFYVVRVYQKSMSDEEMEEEISKATRYVNSFVENK